MPRPRKVSKSDASPLWLPAPAHPDPGADEHQRAAWAACARAVSERRCTTSSDEPAFVELVEALALMMAARESIRRDGWSIETESGSKSNPAQGAYQAFARVFSLLAQRFGLDPRSRQNVAPLPAPPSPDGWARFGGGGS